MLNIDTLNFAHEEIRSAADYQIGECVSELEDAQYRIQELENEE